MKSPRWLKSLACLCLLATPPVANPVLAEDSGTSAVELLFREGIFIAAKPGMIAVYERDRTGSAAPKGFAVQDENILLGVVNDATGTGQLTLEISSKDKGTETLSFPAQGGNPVLMLLLESTMRSMSTLAGGNPAYIRNRIKDAIRAGGEVSPQTVHWAGTDHPGHIITLRPFAQDPKRDRMGEFASLTLRFTVSDAVPGYFLELAADTPDAATGYHERIALMPEGSAR